MSEEEIPTEEELSSDLHAAAAEMDRANKKRMLETLADMGITVDQSAIDTEDKKLEDPLGALEDFSNATRIPVPGLQAAFADHVKEPEPLNREGSGLFTSEARARLESKPAKVDRDPWSRETALLGKVVATEEHREIYEDVFFSDEPLQLPVHLVVAGRRITVTCRTLSGYEREVTAQAVRQLAENHPLLKSAPQIVLSEYILRANMLMMIVDVDGTPWPCVRCEPAPGVSPGNDPEIGRLVELMTAHFAKVQGRKFALLNRALQTFEVLNDILDDAEINGDFTSPAD